MKISQKVFGKGGREVTINADTDNASIPQQIQGFARLRDQGILTSEEFEKIKDRLLAAIHEPKRIGFQ